MKWLIYEINNKDKTQDKYDYIININRDNSNEPQLTGLYTISENYEEFKRINNLTAFFEDNNNIEYKPIRNEEIINIIKRRIQNLFMDETENIKSDKVYFDKTSRNKISQSKH